MTTAVSARRMPKQKPGKSRQDYQTPSELIHAVKERLEIDAFSIDLAADAFNRVATRWLDEEDDALSVERNWQYVGWCWLNPPFAIMAPWVEKAFRQSEMGAQIAMLVPAAVGSNWWKAWVHLKAEVLFLNGRITFVGEQDCYPKDCAILLYSPRRVPGYGVWSW